MKVEPIQSSVVAKHHTPLYSVHRYFARRPHNVFSNLIEHYAKTPSIILDPFSGGGVTLAEGLTKGHRVIGYEINSQACFIIENQLSAVDPDEISSAVNLCLAHCNEKLGFTYQYEDNQVYWYSWQSFTYCTKCSEKTFLRPERSAGSGVYECEACRNTFRPKLVHKDQIEPTAVCLMNSTSGALNGNSIVMEQLEKEILTHHSTIARQIADSVYVLQDEEKTRIPQCNLEKESALHSKGFQYFEDFITEKNQAWLLCFSEAVKILIESEETQKVLYYILSASLRYTSRFSSLNDGWRKNNRPLEWAKSNFWTPYSFVELNPEIAIRERLAAYIKATKDVKARLPILPLKGSTSDVLASKANYALNNQASQAMVDLPDGSIDLILTDPPYGSYLNYGELTGFWLAWMSKFYSPMASARIINPAEAITSRKRHLENYKSFKDYENELTSIFSECYRVLKESSYMVFTFNNKEPEAWIALLRAIAKAGFVLPEAGVMFQDGVEAYKRTIALRRDGAIHGDFIYSFYKSDDKAFIRRKETGFNWRTVVKDILKEAFICGGVIKNTDLYLKINTALLPRIFSNLNTEVNSEYDQLSDFTFKNLENLLHDQLSFNAGIWSWIDSDEAA